MPFLSENINTIDKKSEWSILPSNEHMSQPKHVEYCIINEKLPVILANSPKQRRKYPTTINKLMKIDITGNGDYLGYNSKFCNVLNKEYLFKKDALDRGIIDIDSFFVQKCSIELTANDKAFLETLKTIDGLINIYIFKRKNFLEYWLETNDNSDVESEIFKRYSIFMEKSTEHIEIIVFNKEELCEGVDIEYDALLKREGWYNAQYKFTHRKIQSQ